MAFIIIFKEDITEFFKPVIFISSGIHIFSRQCIESTFWKSKWRIKITTDWFRNIQ
jgi:hypothetical protein